MLQQTTRVAALLERFAPERHFSSMATPRQPKPERPHPRWSAAERDSPAGASSSGRPQPGAASMVAAAPPPAQAAADEAAPGALVAYQRGRRPHGGEFAPDACDASPAPVDVGLLQRLQSNMRWVATSSRWAASDAVLEATCSC